MTRRLAIAGTGILCALAVAGCGEDVQQRAARELLQRHLVADSRYDLGQAHCTRAARNAYVVQVRTFDFICAVRRATGGCDWWRVDLVSATRGRFALYRSDAGCTLPL